MKTRQPGLFFNFTDCILSKFFLTFANRIKTVSPVAIQSLMVSIGVLVELIVLQLEAIVQSSCSGVIAAQNHDVLQD